MTVRTRFAPSPTGYLHIGGARTALFCYLYARRHGGSFVLRIEDTDRERSTDEAVQAILDGVAWLGLTPDEGPIYQTHRFDRYQAVVDQWLSEGKAYHCYCTREELDERREAQMQAKQKPRYDGRCRDRSEPRDGVAPVVRFANPLEGQVIVEDLVQGRVPFDNAELDDLIIARSDGTPTYNFTVVVDDFDMQISHVVRGDDHLNNTPRQINMYGALGAAPPQFAHVPMILGDDGSRLSKRHGATGVMEYHRQGFLPEALLNYLVRLGWSHGDQELFSMEQMIELFDLADVNKSASKMNPEKLLWVNQQYLTAADPNVLAQDLGTRLAELGVDTTRGPDLAALANVQQARVKTLVEMAEQSVMFYQDFDDYDEKAAKKNLRPVALEPLQHVRDALAGLAQWTAGPIHDVVEASAEQLQLKLGKVAQPIRVAVSGTAVSPGIDITLELLGREVTLARLDRAIAFVKARAEVPPTR